MKAFLSALMFLTRIPVPFVSVTERDWKRSSIHFPFIGLIIGGLLCIAAMVLKQVFSPSVSVFFIILIWIWITGGLHIDGWMDLADGLGSNRSKERMLEIMKDSRVGAMGVIAAICLIGGKFIAAHDLFQENLFFVLIVSPLYARWILIGAIKLWSYRKEGGLGAGLREAITLSVLLFHFVWIAGITYVTLGTKGILLFLSTIVLGAGFTASIYRRLQVLTGDCYGAIVEWCEVTSLFLAIMIWRLFP